MDADAISLVVRARDEASAAFKSIHESLAGIFDKKPKSKSGIVIPQR